MNPNLNLWLIPILPLAGAAINGFFGKKSSRQAVTAVALFFSGAAFAMALWVAVRFSSLSLPYQEFFAHWIRSGNFTADFAFYLDQLSLVMLLVVTGVGFLIHIYSVGYMWEDPSYYRFFGYLNLFMFFMLTLVLAGNYLMMFIGWEGVGLASYLLIGFWFTKDSAASAGKKAFIVNRIGDFGFLIALFLLIKHFGSLNFAQVFQSSTRCAPESRRGFAHHDRHSADGGRVRQVRADSFICLAAGRDGRPDTCLGADSRGHHGDRRRLHGCAVACDLRTCAHRADRSRDHRNANRVLRRDHRHRANRYKEGAGLLHSLAARLHVYCLRRGRIFGGHLSSDDARLLQRSVVSCGRLGDSCGGRRAGHAQDGRPALENSLDLLDHDCRELSPSPEFRRSRDSSAKTKFSGAPTRRVGRTGWWGLSPRCSLRSTCSDYGF